MISASIRGDKGHVRILENGQAISWLELTSFDCSEDSQNQEAYYLGRKKPEVDKNHMGWSGSISGEVKNVEIDLLIQRINDAQKSGVDIPEVSIVLVEEYPDSQSNSTHVFTDCHLTYGNRRQAGVNEKVTKTINFKAGDKRVI